MDELKTHQEELKNAEKEKKNQKVDRMLQYFGKLIERMMEENWSHPTLGKDSADFVKSQCSYQLGPDSPWNTSLWIEGPRSLIDTGKVVFHESHMTFIQYSDSNRTKMFGDHLLYPHYVRLNYDSIPMTKGKIEDMLRNLVKKKLRDRVNVNSDIESEVKKFTLDINKILVWAINHFSIDITTLGLRYNKLWIFEDKSCVRIQDVDLLNGSTSTPSAPETNADQSTSEPSAPDAEENEEEEQEEGA